MTTSRDLRNEIGGISKRNPALPTLASLRSRNTAAIGHEAEAREAEKHHGPCRWFGDRSDARDGAKSVVRHQGDSNEFRLREARDRTGHMKALDAGVDPLVDHKCLKAV